MRLAEDSTVVLHVPESLYAQPVDPSAPHPYLDDDDQLQLLGKHPSHEMLLATPPPHEPLTPLTPPPPPPPPPYPVEEVEEEAVEEPSPPELLLQARLALTPDVATEATEVMAAQSPAGTWHVAQVARPPPRPAHVPLLASPPPLPPLPPPPPPAPPPSGKMYDTPQCTAFGAASPRASRELFNPAPVGKREVRCRRPLSLPLTGSVGWGVRRCRGGGCRTQGHQDVDHAEQAP
jgi:hypothetical protein